MFVEIHSLHTYIGALLNRDENGEAKRMSVGGTLRTRISSQCLKKHWRHAEDEFAVANVAGATGDVRSRNTVRELVVKPLRESGEYPQQVLDAVEHEFNLGVYGANAGTEQHRQSILLGLPEIEFLKAKAAAICQANQDDHAAAAAAVKLLFDRKRPEGRNLRAFIEGAKLPYGLTSAMFGRMITSDVQANIESAISVGHAFTVHEEESQPDFFTAVDDLTGQESAGRTSLLSHTELNTGIYYGNVVVDVRKLVSNCEGVPEPKWTEADPETAAQTVKHLIHLIAKVSPGAKKGSTAPFANADLILAETGCAQPRSLAKAYLSSCDHDIESAISALSRHMEKDDLAWGSQRQRRRRFASTEPASLPEACRTDLFGLAEWAADQVRQAGRDGR